MDLGLDVTERDGWAILAVRGEVDVYTAPRFRERWIELVELEIPARPEFVALARLLVSAMASGHGGLADDRVDDLKLAVSEACTNAIEAHDAIDTDERVIVRCYEVTEGLEVYIEDRGG